MRYIRFYGSVQSLDFSSRMASMELLPNAEIDLDSEPDYNIENIKNLNNLTNMCEQRCGSVGNPYETGTSESLINSTDNSVEANTKDAMQAETPVTMETVKVQENNEDEKLLEHDTVTDNHTIKIVNYSDSEESNNEVYEGNSEESFDDTEKENYVDFKTESELETNLNVNNELNENEVHHYRLVVTYKFDFEFNNENEESFTEIGHEKVDTNSLDDGIGSGDSDSDFEDDLETDGIITQSSDYLGSKNNLLDGSYITDTQACDNDCDDDSFESQFEKALEIQENIMPRQSAEAVIDSSSDFSDDEDEESGNTVESNTTTSTDSSDKDYFSRDNVNNKSMRKGYIYYSSQKQLYSGDLYHSHCDLSLTRRKSFRKKFVNKIFKRVFPTHKYVVNK